MVISLISSLLILIFQSAFTATTFSHTTSETYTSKEQMITQWKTLCDAYPEWASYESIGKSIQGKDIWLFKIGTPSGGRVMYDAQCHGPEDAGTEILYKFCKWLLESGEPIANHILRFNYHLIIPILNVDSTARENMRREYVLENGTVIKIPNGVNLNRNGIYLWGQSGGVDPADSDYRGLYPGSEPETRAYHNAAGKYLPAIYCNTHAGDEVLLHYSHTAYEQEISDRISEFETACNVTEPYPRRGGGAGGNIPVDIDGSFGASGWTWEISTWSNITAPLDEWLKSYYPRALPVILAFAKTTERPPPNYFELIATQENNTQKTEIPLVNLTNCLALPNSSKIFVTPVAEYDNSNNLERQYLYLSNSTLPLKDMPVQNGNRILYEPVEIKIETQGDQSLFEFSCANKTYGSLGPSKLSSELYQFSFQTTNDSGFMNISSKNGGNTSVTILENRLSRDLEITGFSLSANQANVGECITLNCSVKNRGEREENTTLTIYVNNTLLFEQNLEIPPLNTATYANVWLTENLTEGTYELKANVTSIADEVDTANNELVLFGNLTEIVPELPGLTPCLISVSAATFLVAIQTRVKRRTEKMKASTRCINACFNR